jgi:hypothetical protein
MGGSSLSSCSSRSVGFAWLWQLSPTWIDYCSTGICLSAWYCRCMAFRGGAIVVRRY